MSGPATFCSGQTDDKIPVLEGYGFQPVHKSCKIIWPLDPEGMLLPLSAICQLHLVAAHVFVVQVFEPAAQLL